jgi:hypothetical protein
MRVYEHGELVARGPGYKRCTHCGHEFEPYEIDGDDTARLSNVVTLELAIAGDTPPALLDALRAAGQRVLGSRLRSIEIIKTEPRQRARREG